MLGYIEYGDSPKRPELSQRQLAGGTFAVLALGQSAHSASPLARGRAVKGARQMREAGLWPRPWSGGGWRMQGWTPPRRWWPSPETGPSGS